MAECEHEWECWTVGDTLYCQCKKCGLKTEDDMGGLVT